jgi:hypothetical protein
MRSAPLFMLLALAACGAEKSAPERRPEWQGAMVDGIAPLMTPQGVAEALQRRGYRQVPCTQDRPARANMMLRGEEPGCFESADRPMRVHLNFFDLKEGRRLAIVNFHERDLYDKAPQQRLDSGRSLARRFRAHWGKPLTTAQEPEFVTLYWGRPGGSPTLPDLVSVTVSPDLGTSIRMTSFWAYGQRLTPS